MSRDSEKVLKELQKFLDAHAEDTKNEADADALTERFFAEYNQKCIGQKDHAPETADDYLDLAKQVTSKKKSVEYLHKALELEPDCWRNYRSRGIHRTLKPDLYAAAVSDDCEDRWFLEVDLDTESPKKVKEKCEWYHQYYRSGIEQEKHGMFPLTIWIVPNADRKERLLYHLREAFAAEPVKLFTVITIEELPVLLQKGGNPDAQC